MERFTLYSSNTVIISSMPVEQSYYPDIFYQDDHELLPFH